MFVVLIIVWETHDGGLAGHFGRDKKLAHIKEKFYWQNLEQGVIQRIQRCRICHISKCGNQNTSLYKPLPVPRAPWKDVCNTPTTILYMPFFVQANFFCS